MTEAAVSPGRSLVPGTILGERFEILSPIGQGAMGTVYKAHDSAADREVAVKVLHRHLTESREYVARFKREAQVASRFRHEAAVRMLGSGDTEDGLPYIAMELVTGRSLKELIAQEAPIPYGRALNLAAQVLRALGAAHRQGIVHRDVKPDNVRVEFDADGIERPKLLDFGVAKLIGAGDVGEDVTGALKTKTGVILGTPKYMSPEQIRGEAIDGRSDIYAVGTLVYEMITGSPPFDADDVFGFITKHLKERVPPIDEAYPELEIPLQVDEVILRMLAKDPADRPVDAAALADELEPYAVEDPRAAEKGRALRTGLLAVGGAGVGAALAAPFLTSIGLAPSAAAAGLALGACVAAARVPRPSVVGYLRRVGYVAGLVTVLELAAALLPGGNAIICASLGLVAMLVYVALMMVWSSRAVWMRPVVAGLGAPLAGLAVVAVRVQVESDSGEITKYFGFLDQDIPTALEPLVRSARLDMLLAVALVALPFALASIMLPRPGAARLG